MFFLATVVCMVPSDSILLVAWKLNSRFIRKISQTELCSESRCVNAEISFCCIHFSKQWCNLYNMTSWLSIQNLKRLFKHVHMWQWNCFFSTYISIQNLSDQNQGIGNINVHSWSLNFWKRSIQNCSEKPLVDLVYRVHVMRRKRCLRFEKVQQFLSGPGS